MGEAYAAMFPLPFNNTNCNRICEAEKAQHEKRMRNEVEKEAKSAVAAQEC